VSINKPLIPFKTIIVYFRTLEPLGSTGTKKGNRQTKILTDFKTILGNLKEQQAQMFKLCHNVNNIMT